MLLLAILREYINSSRLISTAYVTSIQPNGLVISCSKTHSSYSCTCWDRVHLSPSSCTRVLYYVSLDKTVINPGFRLTVCETYTSFTGLNVTVPGLNCNLLQSFLVRCNLIQTQCRGCNQPQKQWTESYRDNTLNRNYKQDVIYPMWDRAHLSPLSQSVTLLVSLVSYLYQFPGKLYVTYTSFLSQNVTLYYRHNEEDVTSLRNIGQNVTETRLSLETTNMM